MLSSHVRFGFIGVSQDMTRVIDTVNSVVVSAAKRNEVLCFALVIACEAW